MLGKALDWCDQTNKENDGHTDGERGRRREIGEGQSGREGLKGTRDLALVFVANHLCFLGVGSLGVCVVIGYWALKSL